MPTLIKILDPSGLHDVTYSADSLADAAQYEPTNGIYTVANTFEVYKTIKLDAHFDRLEHSAQLAQIPIQLDRGAIRAALRQMIAESGFGDVRFRVTVGEDAPEQLLLTIEPFTPPSQEVVTKGVRCITAPNSARSSAEAKTTDWMHARKSLAETMPKGIYDIFLLDADGYLLEGLGSNFYAILGGELRTAGENVLKGIAQQIVFEVAPEILPIRKEAIHISDMTSCSEAFLTSSSRGIIPVVEIDGVPINNIKPGELTRKLQQAYNHWVKVNSSSL